jgi:hypothetical protein
MRLERIVLSLGIAVSIAATATPVRAQDPKFEYAKEPEKEVPATEWKASAQAGLVLTTGNAVTRTLSGGLLASRLSGKNKLQLELVGTYVRSGLFIFTDTDGDMKVDAGEYQRSSQTTAKGYAAKARYDRFFTAKNSLYLTGTIGADVPAGKDLFAGGQLGYSRLVLKTSVHELTAEAGFDATYEDLALAGVDGVAIFSGRVFFGYAGTVSATTGISASAEALFNVNTEDAPYLPEGEVGPGEDTRVIGKLALTSKLYSDISVRLGFSAKFDNAPAPLAGFAGLPFDSAVPPLTEKLDTVTELSVIVNFL